jgi:hypothetical protein
MDLKVHHVWSKAPIRCKKYPAVAGYFIKWTINGPKRGAKKRALWGFIPEKKALLFWKLEWL